MRWCVDVTHEQARILDELSQECSWAQARFSLAVNILTAGRGVPKGAVFSGLRADGVIPDGASHVNGALPKMDGRVPMLDFDVEG